MTWILLAGAQRWFLHPLDCLWKCQRISISSSDSHSCYLGIMALLSTRYQPLTETPTATGTATLWRPSSSLWTRKGEVGSCRRGTAWSPSFLSGDSWRALRARFRMPGSWGRRLCWWRPCKEASREMVAFHKICWWSPWQGAGNIMWLECRTCWLKNGLLFHAAECMISL